MRVRCPRCGEMAGSDPRFPLTWKDVKRTACGERIILCPRGHEIPVVARDALRSA
jgi:hypothetical protein